jgi:hypothetical protein
MSGSVDDDPSRRDFSCEPPGDSDVSRVAQFAIDDFLAPAFAALLENADVDCVEKLQAAWRLSEVDEAAAAAVSGLLKATASAPTREVASLKVTAFDAAFDVMPKGCDVDQVYLDRS